MPNLSTVLSVAQPSGQYKYFRTHRSVDEWGHTPSHDPAGQRGPGVHFAQVLPRVPLGSVEVGLGDVPLGSLAQESQGIVGPVAVALTLVIVLYLANR